MNPGLLKMFFRLAMFVMLTSLFLVFAVPKGTAEHVVSVLSLVIGLLLIGLIGLLSYFSRR